jgi:hypothetical protein
VLRSSLGRPADSFGRSSYTAQSITRERGEIDVAKKKKAKKTGKKKAAKKRKR